MMDITVSAKTVLMVMVSSVVQTTVHWVFTTAAATQPAFLMLTASRATVLTIIAVSLKYARTTTLQHFAALQQCAKLLKMVSFTL